MARINFDDSIEIDPSFRRLVRKLGDEDRARGMLIRLWRLGQHYWKDGRGLIPVEVFMGEDLSVMLDCELARAVQKGEKHDEIAFDHSGIYVRGARKHFEWLAKKSEAGKARASSASRQGGRFVKIEPSEKPATSTPPAQSPAHTVAEPALHQPLTLTPSLSLSPALAPALTQKHKSKSSGGVIESGSARSPGEKSLGAEIFQAYAHAYRNRYGVEPVRNATVNAQCTQLGKRLGQEALDVVKFYVWHNRAYYVQKGHPIGLALSDAESLRTEWLTGRQMTSVEARDLERRQSNVNAFAKILAEKKGDET